MRTPIRLTACVQESTLQDGTRVHVGTIEEVPGIYTQSAAREKAIAALVELLDDLHDRIGLPVIGVRTPDVQGWAWTIAPAGGPFESYGSEAGEAAGMPSAVDERLMEAST